MPYKFPGTEDDFTAAIAAARVARVEDRLAIERRASDEFLARVAPEERGVPASARRGRADV